MSIYKLSLILFLIIILLIHLKRTFFSKKRKNSSKIFEFFSNNNSNKIVLYQEMIDNHYNKIFPNDANRNSVGFRFFKYIYDNLAENNELFDIYNSFYCAVSGSIVSPDDDNFSILKVKKNGTNECEIGKYYRCCTPCNCDIMKYSRVVEATLEIPKGSKSFFKKNLLTIGDPCLHEEKLPDELDENVFKCDKNKLQLGYRVTNDGLLTEGEGRLVIGVLFPIDNKEINLLESSVNECLTGTKRFLSNENNLEYGMGDIFVKLSLINNNSTYTHTVNDFCSL